MLTLEQLYQQYFPSKPYPYDSMEESDHFIPLWDFLIFLGSHGYVFTDVYFGVKDSYPESQKSRPTPQNLKQLKTTLTKIPKDGHSVFYISEYFDYVYYRNRIISWVGEPPNIRLQIEPLILEPELATPQQPITGFRMTIEWKRKIWKIYLGTQPTDSYAAADLNALLRKYTPLKYIINYCYRMPTLDE